MRKSSSACPAWPERSRQTFPTSSNVEDAFDDAVRIMGGVDVLINNAGISIRHDFLKITPEEWDKVIAVNLTGVFYMAQTAARHMWERDGGVILQTASTNGIVGQPYYADYNATKAGVIELTRTMALELAPKVRVCAVAPGYVLTPMQRAEYTDAMLGRSKSQDSAAAARQAGRDRGPVCLSGVGRCSVHNRPGLHDRRRRNRGRAGKQVVSPRLVLVSVTAAQKTWSCGKGAASEAGGTSDFGWRSASSAAVTALE